MKELPDILVRGERARLFPVLADTSREGRTLSIFLSCFETVPEFGRALLSSVGAPSGARTQIEAYTEVGLKKGGDKPNLRPDGLIVVKNGNRRWLALIEAKVGNSDLTGEQMEGYLELARLNGVDALITLSNQFASLPTHHPVAVSTASRRKVELFHWSWLYVVTQASLLLSNEEVTDREQRVILREMNRFLLHPSSGVKSFDQMPASWTEVVNKVLAGGTVSPNSVESREIIGAWHQELGDLSLVLSRQLERTVRIRMPRAHATDPAERQKADQRTLSEQAQLTTNLDIPDVADVIQVCADLKTRSITVSMRLRAPDEPKGARARVNWLIKQLGKADPAAVHVRCSWPGRSRATQQPLGALRDDPGLVIAERDGQSVLSFEVLMARDLGAKFGQRKNFLAELEAVVPEFYSQVAQHLKAWQPRAPKLREEKSEPADVTPEALRQEIELEALAGDA